MALLNSFRSVKIISVFGFLLLGLSAIIEAASLDEARLAIRTRQYELAHQLLIEPAEEGDTQAQYLLASLYRDGKGSKQDDRISADWLTRAAKNDYGKAQYDLGTCYEGGKGRKVNIETALFWYQKAADAGHKQAKTKLDVLSSVELKSEYSDFDPLLKLLSLIRKNKLYSLKLLLKQYSSNGYDINAADEYGTTALIFAVERGELQMVKILLDIGASPDHKNQYGQSVISIAAKNSRLAIMIEILNYKPNLNSKDNLGNTGLHLAVKKNHLQIVRLILDAGGNPNITNNAGNTVLDLAAFNKNNDMIALLKNEHAVQARRPDGGQSREKATGSMLAKNAVQQSLIANNKENPFKNWPALNLAAWRGQYDHVQALLNTLDKDRLGIDGLDQEYHSPLSRASWQGHTKIVGQLLAAGARLDHRLPGGQTPLYLAVSSGRVDTVKLLLKWGADLNHGVDDESMLIIASRKGHEIIALELIKYGANVDSPRGGKTALMWAAQHGQNVLLEQLVKFEADLNYQDSQKRTALSLAISENRSKSVKILLSAGSNWSLSDSEKNTPLAHAAKFGHLSIVDQLLNTSTDVNSVNLQKNTPLILAAIGGHVDVMDILINKGADFSLRNKASNTALMISAKNGQLPAVKLLLGSGADPKRRNSKGRNTIELARLAKKDVIADFIIENTTSSHLFDLFN